MFFGLTQPITKYNTLDWSGANNTETLFNTDCYLPILNTLARTLHDNNVELFWAGVANNTCCLGAAERPKAAQTTKCCLTLPPETTHVVGNGCDSGAVSPFLALV